MTERDAINTERDAINELKELKEYLLTEERREAFDLAIAALEKQEKYKWHDLRKDPCDLPDELHQVLAKVTDSYNPNVKYDCSWIYYGDWVHTEGEVIAWRYIEPFEVGDTE